jgi:hypothetical protein
VTSLPTGNRKWLAWRAAMKDCEISAICAPINAPHITVLTGMNYPSGAICAERLSGGLQSVVGRNVSESRALKTKVKASSPREKGKGRRLMSSKPRHQARWI